MKRRLSQKKIIEIGEIIGAYTHFIHSPECQMIPEEVILSMAKNAVNKIIEVVEQ